MRANKTDAGKGMKTMTRMVLMTMVTAMITITKRFATPL